VTTDGHGPPASDDAERGAIGGEANRRDLVHAGIMNGAAPDAEADGEQVTRPAKLVRLASMASVMLDEVRLAPLDDAGRRRLREIHERSIQELAGILSPDLHAELDNVVLPFTSDVPSESELRLAQAQLVGWLQGLFLGIQTALFTQQATAQEQFAEMRRRALTASSGAGEPPVRPGPYL
jgi:hypothetical protein